MKKSIISTLLFYGLFAVSLLVTGCGSKQTGHNEQTEDATKSDSTYACAMHPEIKGKAGDVCSKCGMKLEAMRSSDSTMDHHH